MATKRLPAKKKDGLVRPLPPDAVIEGSLCGTYAPAPEVWAWIEKTFLDEEGALHNPEHEHLRQASVGVLWTNDIYIKQGLRVAGTAEMPVFRCSAWQRGRQEQQLREWFNGIPDFVITFDANFANVATDAEFCAVVEHELYHCAQEKTLTGQPAFTKWGTPKFEIRGHDVEEFVGVVRRYGVGHPEGRLAALVKAANKAPEVSNLEIARACGTCHLKVA